MRGVLAQIPLEISSKEICRGTNSARCRHDLLAIIAHDSRHGAPSSCAMTAFALQIPSLQLALLLLYRYSQPGESP
jgi:hypothetical protein